MNVNSVKAVLMAICIGLIPTIEDKDNQNIIVITNSLSAARKIIKSHITPFQKIIVPLATKIFSFKKENNHCNVQFWYCLSKAEWPKHKLVNEQVKEADNVPVYPNKNSFSFSKKKECNDILKEWQSSFARDKNEG